VKGDSRDVPPKGRHVVVSSALILAAAIGAWWLIVTDRGSRIERVSLWLIAVSTSAALLMVAAATVVAVWDWRRRAARDPYRPPDKRACD
jgi:hypothetical protein